MLKFKATTKEMAMIRKIALRAKAIASKLNTFSAYDIFDYQMDLQAVHSNGNPIDFEKLLKFDDANFAHDIFGIANHLDRDNGKLQHCFVPRCSLPATQRRKNVTR